MNKLHVFACAAAAASLLACGGGGDATPEDDTSAGDETTVDVVRDEAPAEEVALTATAQLNPTQGNSVTGTVRFRETADGVEVSVRASGLAPGSTHGFHVHENGDCSAPDGTSAGGHFNPGGVDHALPPTEVRHAGDLGNVVADEEGNVEMTETFTGLTLGEGPTSVVGRGLIMHAGEDRGTQPTGDAGARIACAVIALDPS